MKRPLLLVVTLLAICWPCMASVITVSSSTQLVNALSSAANNDTIRLSASVNIRIINGTVSGKRASQFVISGKNLTIDLAGYAICAANSTSADCFLFSVTNNCTVRFTSSLGQGILLGRSSNTLYSGTGFTSLILAEGASHVDIEHITFLNEIDEYCIRYSSKAYGMVDDCHFVHSLLLNNTAYTGNGGGVCSTSQGTLGDTNRQATVRNCSANLSNYTLGVAGHSATALCADEGGCLRVLSGDYTSATACLYTRFNGGTIEVYGGTFQCTDTRVPDISGSGITQKYYTGSIFVDNGSSVSVPSSVVVHGGAFRGYLFLKDDNETSLSIHGGVFDISGVVGKYSDFSSLLAPDKQTMHAGDIYHVVNDSAQYTRTKGSGTFGTVCLPRTTTSTSGATFYSIAYCDGLYLYLDEIADSDILAAGQPYIFAFHPDASSLTCTYNPASEVPFAADTCNGLIGTLVDLNCYNGSILSSSYSFLAGMYLLSSDRLLPCTDGCALAANRAYIDMSLVPANPAPAPSGLRRVAFPLDPSGTPTWVSFPSADCSSAGMVLLNGHIYVRRGTDLYSLSGTLVQHTGVR